MPLGTFPPTTFPYSYFGWVEGSVNIITHEPLRSRIRLPDGSQQVTLEMFGNTIPIEAVRSIPEAPPKHNRGVFFQINNDNTVTIWVWDAQDAVWRQK